MTESFDPYLKWLGIAPKDQPPHHYRLLGIDLFTDDPEVIEASASRQMAHVRTYQSGQHASLSQQLLNEIATAKICLLKPEMKAAYDRELKRRPEPARKPPAQNAPPKPKRNLPPVVAQTHEFDFQAPKPERNVGTRRAKSKSPAWLFPVLGGGAVCGIVLLFLAVSMFAFRGTPSLDDPSQSSGPDLVSEEHSAREVESVQRDATQRSINLLKLIDLKRDALDPGFRMGNGVLLTPPWKRTTSRVVIPLKNVPQEYDIHLVAERRSNQGMSLNLGVVMGGHQASVDMDGGPHAAWCLSRIDGKSMHDGNITTAIGRRLFLNTKVNVDISVRRNGVRVVSANETVIDWKGRPEQLSLWDKIELPRSDTLFLFSQSEFAVHELWLTPVVSGQSISTPLWPREGGVGKLDAGGRPADMSKPVQVYILLGQSNMLGSGRVGGAGRLGTLEHAVKAESLYPFLVDGTGNWTVRKDVRNVRVMGSGMGDKTDHNNDWMTIAGDKIGPEIGIGHRMGNVSDAPVLILKSCIGNRSLGWDLLPPGSEQFEQDGMIYAGYKQSPDKWKKGTTPKPIGWYAGMQYDGDIARAKQVLAELDKYYPGAEGYEVAGFFWWQGDKDRNDAAHAGRYEKNLVRLIEQLRKDFEAPRAKFVCATLGQTSKGAGGTEGLILNSQLAVDGETGKYPKFKGNVATVYSKPLCQGGSSGVHYNGDAKTYMNIGLAMGEAMAKLLEDEE